MNGIEDEVVEKKDLSRPYFPRNAGEVAVYVDVDDAVSEDAHAYGSEQLMRIEMNEALGELLGKRDLVRVKAELDRRGHFRGVILEEFRRGPNLAVTFDSVADLEELWKLHEGKQLTPLFQLLLVDRALLKSLHVRKLTLRVRMWPDELEVCREELRHMAKEDKRVDITTRPRDVALLQEARRYQRDASGMLQTVREREAEVDAHLSELLLVVKGALPTTTTAIPSLKVFSTNMTVAMGTKPKGMQHVKTYLATIELLRTLLAQAEASVYQPLMLVPARCETAKQREVKGQMRAAVAELTGLLAPSSGLQGVCCKEWENKILPRERTLFLGLISLVPLGVEKVTDVDTLFDEYVTGFPSL